MEGLFTATILIGFITLLLLTSAIYLLILLNEESADVLYAPANKRTGLTYVRSTKAPAHRIIWIALANWYLYFLERVRWEFVTPQA